MTEPTQPLHPFIEPGSGEGTYLAINGVLAFLQDRLYRECEVVGGSLPVGVDHIVGELRILEGLRSAVKYLSHLDAVPTGNVTKLGEK